jgi:hypothetical protein
MISCNLDTTFKKIEIETFIQVAIKVQNNYKIQLQKRHNKCSNSQYVGPLMATEVALDVPVTNTVTSVHLTTMVRERLWLQHMMPLGSVEEIRLRKLAGSFLPLLCLPPLAA